MIIGGDFNVIFDQELDGAGGLKKTKDSVKFLEDICLEHDLLDIWRVRHPNILLGVKKLQLFRDA